jgi:hypothetical protein
MCMLLNYSQVYHFSNCALFLIKQFPVYTYYTEESVIVQRQLSRLCVTLYKSFNLPSGVQYLLPQMEGSERNEAS